MKKSLTIKDKELDSLFQKILPPEEFGEDSNVEELYNRIIQLEANNKKHGGKRPGSGRPKLKKSQKKEATKVMRIPVSKVSEVKTIIEK